MSQTFVVVGAGLAAAKAVEELRSGGFEGDVVVFGDEHHLPYERPPLSKGYLLGNDELETAFVHDPDWYDENDVDLRLGQQVTAIDTAGARRAHPRRAAGLRPAAARDRVAPAAPRDGRRLRRPGGLPPHHRGQPAAQGGVRRRRPASWSSAAAGSGSRPPRPPARPAPTVTVLESLDLPLLRVLGPEVAAGLRRPAPRARRRPAHSASRSPAIEKDGARAVVRLADGGSVRPTWSWSASASRPTSRSPRRPGWRPTTASWSTSTSRTSDPDVFAAGDVANAQHPVLGPAGPGRALGHRDRAGQDRRARDARPRRRPTTGCPTSSPTSTTSAWSTSAASAPTATTRWCCAATPARPAAARSRRSGCRAAGCSPACTSTTGTPPTTSARSSARRVDAGRLRDESMSLEDLAKDLTD